MNKTAALRINVTGHVQGVGFRYSAQQKASCLNLTGWVRNEADGSVEICCEGSPSNIALFLDWLDSGGPPYSRISGVNHYSVKYTGAFSRFSVEY